MDRRVIIEGIWGNLDIEVEWNKGTKWNSQVANKDFVISISPYGDLRRGCLSRDRERCRR